MKNSKITTILLAAIAVPLGIIAFNIPMTCEANTKSGSPADEIVHNFGMAVGSRHVVSWGLGGSLVQVLEIGTDGWVLVYHTEGMGAPRFLDKSDPRWSADSSLNANLKYWLNTRGAWYISPPLSE